MSWSHSHATEQNFAESAQSLEMCTPKLENPCIFTIFTCFCPFYVTFRVVFVNFVNFERAKNLLFEYLWESLYRRHQRLICQQLGHVTDQVFGKWDCNNSKF